MSLKQTAAEVLQVIERGHYRHHEHSVDFSDAQRQAVAGSRLYTPDQLASLRSQPSNNGSPPIEVVEGTTQVVAQALAANSHLALLNFASARNPGGGFLNGAKAQEEDLCRCSGLYPCLLQCMDYYEANRQQDSLLYTDHAIFSPGVPFFKIRGTGDFLSAPFEASVITAPAPNTGPFLRKHPDQNEALEAAFVRRWKNVLCIARDQQVRTLLLGAWGCGAFGGDPAMASRTARQALDEFGAAFDHVVFAIPSRGKQSRHNLAVFQETLG